MQEDMAMDIDIGTININQFGSLEPMGMSQHPCLAISNPMAVTAINHSLCL